MSTNTYVYVGPFFNPPKVSRQAENVLYRCPSGCVQDTYPRYKFCPHCGQPIEALTSYAEVIGLLCLDDLEGDWEDEMYMAHRDMGNIKWLPNEDGIGQTLEEGTEESIVITPEVIAAECAVFQKRYQKVADAVKEQFGIDLEVRYGAVSCVM